MNSLHLIYLIEKKMNWVNEWSEWIAPLTNSQTNENKINSLIWFEFVASVSERVVFLSYCWSDKRHWFILFHKINQLAASASNNVAPRKKIDWIISINWWSGLWCRAPFSIIQSNNLFIISPLTPLIAAHELINWFMNQ